MREGRFPLGGAGFSRVRWGCVRWGGQGGRRGHGVRAVTQEVGAGHPAVRAGGGGSSCITCCAGAMFLSCVAASCGGCACGTGVAMLLRQEVWAGHPALRARESGLSCMERLAGAALLRCGAEVLLYGRARRAVRPRRPHRTDARHGGGAVAGTSLRQEVWAGHPAVRAGGGGSSFVRCCAGAVFLRCVAGALSYGRARYPAAPRRRHRARAARGWPWRPGCCFGRKSGRGILQCVPVGEVLPSLGAVQEPRSCVVARRSCFTGGRVGR
ncbi:hypothetical protein AS850_02515 [Frondihabitans sp. 762G35]|nr:hypothetical protein AS850_02515 [Frondihabitans sp. 762G35]